MTDKEKLDYLVDYTITKDEIYPMALANNWSKEDLENIYSIMNKYLELKDYKYTDIENDFREKLNMDYQDLKSLFIYFYNTYKYESVIAKYLETNFMIHGNVSCEYNEIFVEYREKGLIKIK